MDEDELELECVSCENDTEENEIDMLELDADNTTFEDHNVGDQQMQCGQIFISKDRGHLSFMCIFCSVICSKATEFEKHIKCCISDENHAKEKLYIKKEQYEFVSIAENESNGLEDETNHIEDLNEQHSYGNDVGLKSTDRENSGSTINSIDLERNNKLINNKAVKVKLCKVLCNFVRNIEGLKAKKSLESEIVELSSNETKMNSPNSTSSNSWTDLPYCELCDKYIETEENMMEHYKNHAVVNPFMDSTEDFVNYSPSSNDEEIVNEEQRSEIRSETMVSESAGKINKDPHQQRNRSEIFLVGKLPKIDDKLTQADVSKENEDFFNQFKPDTAINNNKSQKNSVNDKKNKKINRRIGDPNLVCKICKMQSSSQRALEKHAEFCRLMLEHSMNLSAFTENDEKNTKSEFDLLKLVAGFSSLTCRFCHLRLKNRRLCMEHECKHTGEKLYKCDICDQSFRIKPLLLAHVDAHKGIRNFKCHLCNAAFTLSTNLQVHIRRHLGEKRYKCKYCDKRFVATSEMFIHERQHTGEKPFQCITCGKCYTNSSQLVEHQRTHGEKKPHKCEQCDKCFVSKKHLRSHSIVHTNGKPLSCDICNATFQRKRTLQSHKKNHTEVNKYVCVICGKGFKLNCNLHNHMKIHETILK